MRWLAGVYFADIDRDVVVSQGSNSGGDFLTQEFVPTGGPNPTDLLYDDSFSSKVYSGFGQLAFDATDSVEIALAARYDSEDREVDNHVPRVPPQTPGFFGTNTFINPAYVQDPLLTEIPSRSKTFDQFQPKLSINWDVSEDWSLYTSYGYGFRSRRLQLPGQRRDGRGVLQRPVRRLGLTPSRDFAPVGFAGLRRQPTAA